MNRSKEDRHQRHDWVCVTEEGLVGEIKKETHLSPQNAELIERAAGSMEKGEIVCSDCSENLFPKDPTEAPVDFKVLSNKLKGPPPGKAEK